jgi:hypothetical protein
MKDYLNNSIQNSLKPASMAFLIILSVVGILTIVVGAFFAYTNHVFWMNAFAALGASILGASLSLLMARVFEPSQMTQVLSLIASSRSSSLIYDDERVVGFRRCYHGYLRSQSDGAPVWRYRIFDFTRSHTPGHLHAIVDVPLPGGGVQLFIYNGYVCDDHLLLIGHPKDGAEPPVIHVFPQGCAIEGTTIVGLAFVRCFDGVQLVAPSILSTVPLTKQSLPGAVDPTDAATLIKIWEGTFMRNNTFNIDTTAHTHVVST